MAYKIFQSSSKFCQILNKSPRITQYFKEFAKVAKFRLICSHWLREQHSTYRICLE